MAEFNGEYGIGDVFAKNTSRHEEDVLDAICYAVDQLYKRKVGLMSNEHIIDDFIGGVGQMIAEIGFAGGTVDRTTAVLPVEQLVWLRDAIIAERGNWGDSADWEEVPREVALVAHMSKKRVQWRCTKSDVWEDVWDGFLWDEKHAVFRIKK